MRSSQTKADGASVSEEENDGVGEEPVESLGKTIAETKELGE
jgi:hypothetical protein